MKIGYRIYKYAPENTTLYFNGFEVPDRVIKKIKLDKYKLYTSNNKIGYIRSLLKCDKNYNKPLIVHFNNYKERIMLNNANSLKAVNRLGWKVKNVEEVKELWLIAQ